VQFLADENFPLPSIRLLSTPTPRGFFQEQHIQELV
jgi:hypothetical protein